MLDSADDVPGIALADADRERTEETLTDAPRLVAPYPDIDMDPETLELAAEWDESDDDEPVRVENMKAHFRRVRARKAVAEALVKSRKTQLDVTAKIPNIAKLPVPKTGTNEPSAQAEIPENANRKRGHRSRNFRKDYSVLLALRDQFREAFARDPSNPSKRFMSRMTPVRADDTTLSPNNPSQTPSSKRPRVSFRVPSPWEDTTLICKGMLHTLVLKIRASNTGDGTTGFRLTPDHELTALIESRMLDGRKRHNPADYLRRRIEQCAAGLATPVECVIATEVSDEGVFHMHGVININPRLKRKLNKALRKAGFQWSENRQFQVKDDDNPTPGYLAYALKKAGRSRLEGMSTSQSLHRRAKILYEATRKVIVEDTKEQKREQLAAKRAR